MNRSTLRPIRTRRFPTTASNTGAVRKNISDLTTKTRKTIVAVGALWLAFASAHAATPAETGSTPATAPRAATELQLSRGKYLVERVGLCSDCHSPRNEKGEFVREAWLKGASLPFQPTIPMPWAPAAPPIAGLPSMTTAQAISFLQDGKRPDGSTPRPPMPEFRFDKTDAMAVVAYLKSLK